MFKFNILLNISRRSFWFLPLRSLLQEGNYFGGTNIVFFLIKVYGLGLRSPVWKPLAPWWRFKSSESNAVKNSVR